MRDGLQDHLSNLFGVGPFCCTHLDVHETLVRTHTQQTVVAVVVAVVAAAVQDTRQLFQGRIGFQQLPNSPVLSGVYATRTD